MNKEKLDELLQQTETDYLDFNQEWYHCNADLVKDILCLSNSLSEQKERYLIIGVYENPDTKQKEKHSVIKNEYRKNAEKVRSLLIDYMDMIPNINIETIDEIDILIIKPNKNDLPYILNKECKAKQDEKSGTQIPKDSIYGRFISNNTPQNKVVSKDYLTKLFRLKYNLDRSLIEKTTDYLLEFDNWSSINDYNLESYYIYEPLLYIKKSDTTENNEYWFLKTWINTKETFYNAISIEYNNKIIETIDCFSTSKNGWFVVPEAEIISYNEDNTDGLRFWYFIKDTLKYNLLCFLKKKIVNDFKLNIESLRELPFIIFENKEEFENFKKIAESKFTKFDIEDYEKNFEYSDYKDITINDEVEYKDFVFQNFLFKKVYETKIYKDIKN